MLSPEDLPHPGFEPTSPVSPAVAGRFFTTSVTWEGQFARAWPTIGAHFSTLPVAIPPLPSCDFPRAYCTPVTALKPFSCVSSSQSLSQPRKYRLLSSFSPFYRQEKCLTERLTAWPSTHSMNWPSEDSNPGRLESRPLEVIIPFANWAQRPTSCFLENMHSYPIQLHKCQCLFLGELPPLHGLTYLPPGFLQFLFSDS